AASRSRPCACRTWPGSISSSWSASAASSVSSVIWPSRSSSVRVGSRTRAPSCPATAACSTGSTRSCSSRRSSTATAWSGWPWPPAAERSDPDFERRRQAVTDLGQHVPGALGPLAATVEDEVARQVLAGLGHPADPGQEQAEVVVGVGELGRPGDHLPQLGDGQLGLAELPEQVAEVVARLGLERVEL